MDSFALGLIKAAKLIEEGTLDNFIKERYKSFDSEIGKKILSKSANLQELAAYAEEMGAPAMPGSGRQEYLQAALNQNLFGEV